MLSKFLSLSLSFSKRNKEENITNVNTSHDQGEDIEKNSIVEKQPILPFTKKEKVKVANNIFKLPTLNFLEKNEIISFIIPLILKYNLPESNFAR